MQQLSQFSDHAKERSSEHAPVLCAGSRQCGTGLSHAICVKLSCQHLLHRDQKGKLSISYMTLYCIGAAKNTFKDCEHFFLDLYHNIFQEILGIWGGAKCFIRPIPTDIF